MANEDLGKIQRGAMKPSGEGLTKAGRVIAVISLLLVLAPIVGNVLFGVFGIAI